jgi:hypothetical protein
MVDTESVYLPLNTRVLLAIMPTLANAMYQLFLCQCEKGKALSDAVPGFVEGSG